MNIFITGIGAISSIGKTVDECFASLKNGKSGIAHSSKGAFNGYIVGEVQIETAELQAQYKAEELISRTTLLGLAAASEAVDGHDLAMPLRTGFVSGTSVGGMDISNGEYLNHINGRPFNKKVFMHHACGTTTLQMAHHLGIKHYTNTISTACSSAANAILLGARMIKAGILDRAVVGGVDSLSIFTLSGFKSLMILDNQLCRPFDQTRNGINIGEGAGYLVLESEKAIQTTKKNAKALLTGWDNSSDAYHQTASSPEGKGAVLAMSKALLMAGVSPGEISYINAHGTATPNNDLTESTAIKTVFGEKVPPFSSTKSFTGHTLGASGGLEAVFSVLSLTHGSIFPNLHFEQPIEETGLIPAGQFKEGQKIKHVLSNSFGFGGNNTSLVFSNL